MILQPIPLRNLASLLRRAAYAALVFLWQTYVQLIVHDHLAATWIGRLAYIGAQQVVVVVFDVSSLEVFVYFIPDLARSVDSDLGFTLDEWLGKALRPEAGGLG
jgi:hypothetical protein